MGRISDSGVEALRANAVGSGLRRPCRAGDENLGSKRTYKISPGMDLEDARRPLNVKAATFVEEEHQHSCDHV